MTLQIQLRYFEKYLIDMIKELKDITHDEKCSDFLNNLNFEKLSTIKKDTITTTNIYQYITNFCENLKDKDISTLSNTSIYNFELNIDVLNEHSRLQLIKYIKFIYTFGCLLIDNVKGKKESNLADIKNIIENLNEEITENENDIDKNLEMAKSTIKQLTGNNNSGINGMIEDITNSLGSHIKNTNVSTDNLLQDLLQGNGGGISGIFDDIKEKYDKKIENGELDPASILTSMQGLLTNLNNETSNVPGMPSFGNLFGQMMNMNSAPAPTSTPTKKRKKKRRRRKKK